VGTEDGYAQNSEKDKGSVCYDVRVLPGIVFQLILSDKNNNEKILDLTTSSLVRGYQNYE
jgi:hypothetical protein